MIVEADGVLDPLPGAHSDDQSNDHAWPDTCQRHTRQTLARSTRTGKDGDDRLVDGLDLLLLQQVACKERDDEEDDQDEERP